MARTNSQNVASHHVRRFMVHFLRPSTLREIERDLVETLDFGQDADVEWALQDVRKVLQKAHALDGEG